MNIERLLLVSETLRKEFKRIKLVDLVRAVTQAITNQISQSSDANLQQISASLDALKIALDSSSLNELPRTWQPMLEAIELDDLIGSQLYDRIRQAIAESQPLLNEAKAKVERIQSRLENAMAAFGELLSASAKLKVQADVLAPGEVELSVLLPRELFSNRFDTFLREGHLIDRLVKTSAVIVTGSAEAAEIKQLSTSDPIIVLVAAPPVILFVMQVINMVLDAYLKVQLIREAKAKAEQAELSERFLKELQEEATKKIYDHVDAFIDDLSKTRQGLALSGANLTEALAKLRDVALKIAARIDRGMRIDAAVEEPTADGGGEGDAQMSATDAAALRALAASTRYFQVDGSPILGLPSPDATNGGGGEGEKA